LTPRRPDYSAPALEKGLDILELLAAEAEGLSQVQIAARLSRTPSEIFRMLDVLLRRGYVDRRADGTYGPTLRLFELAHRQSPVRRLNAAALPVMQRLSLAIRQSTHLVVHFDRRILVVAQVDSPEPMGLSVRLGSHYPFLPDRASAIVLAAFQPPPVQQALVQEMVENSPGRLDVKALHAVLARIRRRGYHQAPSDVIGGVTQFSFPLFGSGPESVAALASPHLKQRDVDVGLVEARAALAAGAREISQALGAGVR
jgi:DNA-binding IclR family transcriptional regulator